MAGIDIRCPKRGFSGNAGVKEGYVHCSKCGYARGYDKSFINNLAAENERKARQKQQEKERKEAEQRAWYASLSPEEKRREDERVAREKRETEEYMRTEYGGEKQAARAKAYQEWARKSLPSIS